MIAVVHHLERPFLGHVAALADQGLGLLQIDRRRGEPLPPLDSLDGVVSLGGEDSVRDLPVYLAEEVPWLGEAVHRGLPVLGVCLGGQLLSHALGGSVHRLPRRMVQWRTALATDPHDPLAAALGGTPLLHWNEDAFTLPEGAVEVLEAYDGGVEAFRFGDRAWGLQFHPDVTGDVLDTWYELPGWLEQAGVEETAAREADARNLPAHAEASRALFRAFAEVVRERRDAPLAH